MKTRNRIVSILMVAALACSMLLFSACGEKKADGPTDVTGTTWALAGGSQGETEVSKADMEALFGGELTYTFSEGGVASMSLADQVLAEGTWTQDGAKVTITVAEESSEMTLDGDTLSVVQGDVTVKLVKK